MRSMIACLNANLCAEKWRRRSKRIMESRGALLMIGVTLSVGRSR